MKLKISKTRSLVNRKKHNLSLFLLSQKKPQRKWGMKFTKILTNE